MAKKAHEGLMPVEFIRGGAGHGYGYAAGEMGLIAPEDFDKLEKAGIVKAAKVPTAPAANYEKR
ncbi:MAG: hypothetical protein IPK76_22970 [Lewinellaceae bacterium]|nr:hypothetical protein [Lewinellaceae bacterium]